MVGTMAGRNDPCPCGSGRKYKKCCMLADQARSDQTTPVKTPEGRREVTQMVNDYENMCARNPQDTFDFNPQDTFDFNRLRRELGLELE